MKSPAPPFPAQGRRIRRLALRIALLTAAPVLCFAIAAAALEIVEFVRNPRGYAGRPTVRSIAARDDISPSVGACFRDDPILPFALIPGQYPIRNGTVTINSLGYRGREFARTRTPGMLRILFVGDSFTFGYGVDDNETLPRCVERALDDAFASVEVINAGFHGYAPAHYELYLRTEGYALEPDVIVPVLYGGNDLSDIHYTWVAEYGPDGRPARITDSLIAYHGRRYHSALPGPLYFLPMLDRSVLWYQINRGLYSALVVPRQRRLTRSQSEAFFTRPLLAIFDESRRRGIEVFPWVVVGRETLDPAGCGWIPEADRRTLGRREHRFICEFLDRSGPAYLDALPVLAPYDADAVCLPHDGHLNARGNAILAEAAAPRIAALLDRRAASASQREAIFADKSRSGAAAPFRKTP